MAAIGLGLVHSSVGVVLALTIAGVLAFTMGLTNNWQSLSLQSDHLLLGSISGKHRAIYADIRQIDVRVYHHSKGHDTVTLWLYLVNAGGSPLQINLKVFGVAQSRILLAALLQFSPQAELNELAMKIYEGEAKFI